MADSEPILQDRTGRATDAQRYSGCGRRVQPVEKVVREVTAGPDPYGGSMSEQRAIEALEAAGLDFTLTRHGRVSSLAEAAEARGVQPSDLIKTLVVRRADDDFLFVLVPGDREISWPKLRSLLGVSRLSMPDKEVAKQATGYERGTITPFGSTTAWPVIADASLTGDPDRSISLGAGAHGVAATVNAEAAVAALEAQVADVTELQ